jgi:hypothetical protein
LTQHYQGKTSVLPVAGRRVPFDVDLGVNARRHLLATYSRCKRESRQFDGAGDLPDYTRGQGCDIYAFDFERQHESKLRASSKTASEYLPTVSVSRKRTGAATTLLAFGRTHDARRRKRGRYMVSELPNLYLGRLDGRGRSRRLPGGPRGRLGGPGPSRLDLDGNRLVFDWTYFPLKSPGVRLFQIRLLNAASGDHKVLDEIGYMSGQLNADFLVAPVIGGNDIYWLLREEGETTEYGTLFRYTLAQHRCASSPARIEPDPISLALDGGIFYYVQKVEFGYEIHMDRYRYGFNGAACGRTPR